MKIMKNKILKKLSIAFSMVVVGLCAFFGISNTYAYTYDSASGNLYSDNLFDIDNVLPIYYSSNHYFRKDIDLSSLGSIDYLTFSWDTSILQSVSIYNYGGSTLFTSASSTDITNKKFTFGLYSYTSSKKFRVEFRCPNTTTLEDFVYFKIMLNKGGTALVFEPYGVEWYSKGNYDQNYNDGYSAGLNAYTQTADIFNGATIMRTLESTSSQFLDINNVSNNGMLSIYSINNALVESIPSSYQGVKTLGFVNLNTKYKASDLTFSYGSLSIGELYLNFGLYDITNDTYIGELPLTITNLDPIASSVGLSSLASIPYLNITNFDNCYLGYIRFSSRAVFSASVDLFFTFDMGYGNGYAVGFDRGLNEGYNNGFNAGETSGYNAGYNAGAKIDGEFTTSGKNLIWTIATTPFEAFKTIWNVNVLGINIAGFITGLITLGVAIFILKKIF